LVLEGLLHVVILGVILLQSSVFVQIVAVWYLVKLLLQLIIGVKDLLFQEFLIFLTLLVKVDPNLTLVLVVFDFCGHRGFFFPIVKVQGLSII
jgi:hypothetical protein